LNSLDKLERKIELTAKDYDDNEKLRFIAQETARQKKNVVKKYSSFEFFNREGEEH